MGRCHKSKSDVKSDIERSEKAKSDMKSDFVE